MKRVFLSRLFLITFFLSITALVVGCNGPTYPMCENDEHCASEDQGAGFCVNGSCAQCRDDSHCKGMGGMVCDSGRCERRAGLCFDDGECAPGQRCRDGACGPMCVADSECGDGEQCVGQRCEVAENTCARDADCQASDRCEDRKCVADTRCQGMRKIYFDFDEHALRADQKENIRYNAELWGQCVDRTGSGRQLRLTGHCDERGTEENNMLLGEKRARTVRKLLARFGVVDQKMDIESRGEYAPEFPDARSEFEHQQNRRVECAFR